MTDTLARARGFLYRHARPLDLARFRYHFEQGTREAVLRALAAYQNPDGGFAHALEPDAWNPHSSPIQTWAATELLREIGFSDSAHPMVQGILRYLASGADTAGDYWLNCVPSNNDYPHAPWWEASPTEDVTHNDNPTACLAGFALRHAPHDSSLWANAHRIAVALAHAYLAQEPLQDMHRALCYVRLLQYAQESGGVPGIDLPALQAKQQQQVTACLSPDIARWETDYVCKPSQFFSDTASCFYPPNAALAAQECAFIIRTQQPDGAWPIPWRWHAYPEEWAITKLWWKANGAVLNLLYLRGMGGMVEA